MKKRQPEVAPYHKLAANLPGSSRLHLTNFQSGFENSVWPVRILAPKYSNLRPSREMHFWCSCNQLQICNKKKGGKHVKLLQAIVGLIILHFPIFLKAEGKIPFISDSQLFTVMANYGQVPSILLRSRHYGISLNKVLGHQENQQFQKSKNLNNVPFLCTKLFQKRGYYSRGDIIQGRTLIKEIRYLYFLENQE